MTPLLAAIVMATKTVAGTEMMKALGHDTTRRISERYSQVLKDAPKTNVGNAAVNAANKTTMGT
jgi:hypothetical protein